MNTFKALLITMMLCGCLLLFQSVIYDRSISADVYILTKGKPKISLDRKVTKQLEKTCQERFTINNGKPGKLWNFGNLFSRPGKAWNFDLSHGKPWKVKITL